MTNLDIMLAGEKAKPLHEIKNSNLIKEQVENLKNLLGDFGLNNGVIRLQIFAENKEGKKETLSSVEFTDKGSMLYHTECF